MGIRNNEIIDFFTDKIKGNPYVELKMLHFYIDSGIKDSLYFWGEFKKALNLYIELKNQCKNLNSFNIGGGFPTIYPDLIPQSLDAYFNEIKEALNNLKLDKLPEIICEPGRAIVAESGSTIVRVDLRKKQKLYINDGTYGTLFDAGFPNIVYPSKMITDGRIISKKLTSFDFYGPTCDSMDYMKGPFISVSYTHLTLPTKA